MIPQRNSCSALGLWEFGMLVGSDTIQLDQDWRTHAAVAAHSSLLFAMIWIGTLPGFTIGRVGA